jgi:DNA topoisomerase-3
MEVCLAVNPRLNVKRARFSALVARELHAAVANLVLPNKLDADAVCVNLTCDDVWCVAAV